MIPISNIAWVTIGITKLHNTFSTAVKSQVP